MSKTIAVGACLSLAIVVTIGVARLDQRDEDRPASALAASPGQSADPAVSTPKEQSDYPAVSGSILATVKSQGTDVEVVDDVPAADLSEAIALAQASFGWTSDVQPSEVSVVRLTVAGDPTVEPDPKTQLKDRLAWMIVFPDIKVPYFGPAPKAGESQPQPEYAGAPFAEYIDATTGEFLRAESAG